MQATQEAHMMDTCTIDRYAEGAVDGFNNPSKSYPSDTPISCGFMVTSAAEGLDHNEADLQDAQIRLPITTIIDLKDRITITHRHGVAISPPLQYEVFGQPKKGPSGLVVGLKKRNDA